MDQIYSLPFFFKEKKLAAFYIFSKELIITENRKGLEARYNY